MKLLTRFRFFLWRFGRFQVPMIGYLKPRLIKLDDQEIIMCIPLRRRSRNHLNSMYFGALSVGADLAGGLHGFYHANQQNEQISLAFKSFQAQFLRRPEADVYFVCTEGAVVADMIHESKRSNNRITKPITIRAFTDYPALKEEIAHFILELSLKVRA